MGLFSKLTGGVSGLFAPSGDSVVGLDIGSSSIKAVQLKKKGGRAVLETYGELSIGPYAAKSVGQVVNLSVDQTVEAVKDLFREANITGNIAAMSIPTRSSLLKVIELPSYKEDQINRMVPIEARKYIPVPISEVSLDWWIIPHQQKGNGGSTPPTRKGSIRSSEVLLVAIHKSTVKRYQNIISKLDLRAKTFEIETFSAMRSLIDRGIDATAVLDLGAATSKLSIVDYGIVRRSHTINRGGQNVTQALARSQGIDFNTAEKMKRDQGLEATAESIIDFIFYETNKVITDYQKNYGRLVTKLILTGGGALLEGIVPAAKKVIEAEVVHGDPFGKTEAPAFLAEILQKTGPEFSVSVGLALGELSSM